MRIHVLTILLLLSLPLAGQAQQDTLPRPKDYRFIIQDAPARLFTMRQMNESYLSGYRMMSRVLDQEVGT
ncbi:MAG: hypothetical protein GX098_01745, partial [Bacteroidales bacterium]|nr:hypothetical protein [Bacteroidales bacterium]